ncbi:phasin family protein [Ancylobacter sp.]|uniref:phasin family protein n=1 Tax=Ancylobacter sp. TaxID=1872567 RepID=UPI003D10B5DC
MADTPKLEIPPELRNIAEQGMGQARVAMDGFLSAAHKALDDAGRHVDTAQGSARDLGRTTLDFAEANIAAGFDFASRLAKATTVDEWARLHADYVQEQAARLTEQAKAMGERTSAAASFATGTKPGK